jgi:hypothetical protein
MRTIASSLALSLLMASWPRLTAEAQATPQMMRVQIINATSVPVLALRVNGTLAYDTFPQGKRSGDAPVPLLEAVYEAEDKRSGLKAKSDKIIYEHGTYQSLVILGDFSATLLEGILRKPDGSAGSEDGKHRPNVLFQVYPHTPSNAPVRLRIINGMPGKSLTFAKDDNEVVVRSGECALLESQPPTARYTAHMDGQSIPLLMRQEGLVRNAIIVLFLKEGRPTFMRAFENNAEIESNTR